MLGFVGGGGLVVGKKSPRLGQAQGRRSFCGRLVCMAVGTDGSPVYKYLILGGGNAAGYAAKELVAQGVGKSEAAIVSREAVAPYERPALSKAFLFADPPARLPGFYTCVGGGGERQAPDWYEKNGIDLLLGEEIVAANLDGKTLESKTGKKIGFEKLIIATGCAPIVLSKLEGADLDGVHYLRENADALELYDALQANKGKEILVVGGGYIGMEVAAAAAIVGCKPKMIYPEEHLMPRLFFDSLAEKYEQFYQSKGIKFFSNGRLCEAFLGDDSGKVRGIRVCKDDKKEDISGSLCVVGVGARPNVSLFEGQLEMDKGGIKVDSSFKSSNPDVYAIGDIATFPLKKYGGKSTRMEHVAHARQSATHVIKALFGSTEEYDYLPYFYSRVFNLSWQFFGDNVGEPYLFGNMEPKLSAFWIDGSQVNGVFMESPNEEDTAAMKAIATKQPTVDMAALKAATTADEALKIVANA